MTSQRDQQERGTRRLFVILALTALAMIAASLWGTGAYAQTPSLTFSAESVVGVESVVPKFTWSTSPAGATCTASGDAAWTGAKLGSGSEVLASINASKSYTLSCNWPGDTQAELMWLRPTTYTNGSPLTVAKYTVAFSTSLTDVLLSPLPAGVQKRDHNFPAAQSATVTGITAPGTYFFCVRALDAAGTASDCGKRVDDQTYPAKTITGAASQSRSISITVNPKPGAATSVEVK